MKLPLLTEVFNFHVFETTNESPVGGGGAEDGDCGESPEEQDLAMAEAPGGNPDDLLKRWADHFGYEFDPADKKVKVAWTGQDGSSGKDDFLWHKGGQHFLKRDANSQPEKLNPDDLDYVLRTGKDPKTEDYFG